MAGDSLLSEGLSIVQVPQFAERNHLLIKALARHSDLELLALLQRHPDQGRYFVALFCRYSALVYALIWHLARSPAEADYLFAYAWRSIYEQLPTLDLQEQVSPAADGVSLQSWIIQAAALCINQLELPPTPTTSYSLAIAPPLWCYVQSALDHLPPLTRMIVVLSHTFQWPLEEVLSQLHTEGEALSLENVQTYLESGLKQLIVALPEDIQLIYLDEKSLATPQV
jgi:DNA-directed RNA polymerase specialized sigma24 family protein